MGLDDIVNKAKEAFKDEEKTDQLLDKASDLINSKAAGHEDKVEQGRDFLDKKLGSE